jgi:hypothetical protein
MKILFQDDTTFDLNLLDNPMAKFYAGACKHLQHISIPFSQWDSPFYTDRLNYSECVDRLEFYGKQLGITVDQQECRNQSQQHFNFLHNIYEKNYDGNPKWLEFHEHIHICENYYKPMRRSVALDYREKSGFLEKNVNVTSLVDLKTNVKKGDAYLAWAELGKIPYQYWKDQETNDFSRMCNLAKPWIKLRPKLFIALEDIDFLKDQTEVEKFNQWWDQYHLEWCKHWDIPQWSLDQMFGVAVIGNVNHVEKLKDLLSNGVYPERIKL